MRIALLIVLALSACAKKQAAPKSPAPATGSADSKEAPAAESAPAPAASGGSQPTTKSDPEEGGQ